MTSMHRCWTCGKLTPIATQDCPDCQAADLVAMQEADLGVVEEKVGDLPVHSANEVGEPVVSDPGRSRLGTAPSGRRGVGLSRPGQGLPQVPEG